MSNNLGEFLKNLRVAKGFTLRAVEEKTKVSNGYLNQIENGNVKEPSPRILHKIAEVYGTTYERLLEEAGYWTMKKSHSGGRKAEGVAFSLLEDLTKPEEAELLDYLHFMRERAKKK